MTLPEYANEDSFLWLAHDLPHPRQYAEALLMRRRDLARELLAVRKTRSGWRFQYDPEDSRTINEMRGLGLCDVAGALATHQRTGPGWDVTPFGLLVRNRLLQIINTRELEVSLENEEPVE